MSDESQPDPVREELLKQAIILAFGIVTLILYTIGQRKMGEPDFVEDFRRWMGFGKPSRRDPEAEALEQVQREISLMEHDQGSCDGYSAGH